MMQPMRSLGMVISCVCALFGGTPCAFCRGYAAGIWPITEIKDKQSNSTLIGSLLESHLSGFFILFAPIFLGGGRDLRMELCHSMNAGSVVRIPWGGRDPQTLPYHKNSFVWTFLHSQMAGCRRFGCSRPSHLVKLSLTIFLLAFCFVNKSFDVDTWRTSNCKSRELRSTYPVPWCPVIRVSGWGRASPLAVTNLVVPPSSLAVKTCIN